MATYDQQIPLPIKPLTLPIVPQRIVPQRIALESNHLLRLFSGGFDDRFDDRDVARVRQLAASC